MKRVETRLPAGKIIDTPKMPDVTLVITQEYEDKATHKEACSVLKVTMPEIIYRRVEAESLSVDDEFMKHEPRTKSEKATGDLIKEVINKGVKNYYKPIMDPSFTVDGNNICFERGKMPALDKSFNWWIDAARKFYPERNSRLGTRLEYGAFVGVFIKELIASGKSIEWAWHAVCNDSKELGHYRNSENAKADFELTGSRPVCTYCDLGNAYKILAEDVDTGGFWLAGGRYYNYGSYKPIVDLCYYTKREFPNGNCVGWVVLS